MGYKIGWSKVWVLVFVLMITSTWQTFAKGPNSDTKDSNLSAPILKGLLRKTATAKANCEKEKCDRLAILKEHYKVLKQLIDTHAKLEITSEENKTLRSQAKTFQKSVAVDPKGGCLKNKILEDKLIELGIQENGNLLYNKRPSGDGAAQCWSNSKKKKDATVILCDFPLAVNILTKGGKSGQEINRSQEYMFDLNGCSLVSVKLTDETKAAKKETFLSIPVCKEQWNKRTADASMTKAQVRRMEETIRLCFKYQILPADETPQKSPKTKVEN